MPVHGNEIIPEVKLFHFSLACWVSMISPLLQSSLGWYLGHYWYHYVRFSLLEIFLCKHMCIRMEHYLALQLHHCICIPFACQYWSVGACLLTNSCVYAEPWRLYCSLCYDFWHSRDLKRCLGSCLRLNWVWFCWNVRLNVSRGTIRATMGNIIGNGILQH